MAEEEEVSKLSFALAKANSLVSTASFMLVSSP